jgi:hypothetical protein
MIKFLLASLKILTYSEDCSESSIRISKSDFPSLSLVDFFQYTKYALQAQSQFLKFTFSVSSGGSSLHKSCVDSGLFTLHKILAFQFQ